MKLWHFGGWVVWSTTCTCRSWHGCRGHSLQDQFENLIVEPPWRQSRLLCNFCNFPMSFSFSALLSQSVKMGTIWLSWKGSVSFQHMSSSTDYGDGNFSISLGSFHRPIPVRYNWSVFARKMHSTSEFAKIVLSKCVCVCVSSVLLVRSHAFHFCPPLFHAKNINLLDVKRNLAEPLRSARPIRVLDCRAAKWM